MKMDAFNDSSEEENLGLKPCVTWDFNSQPENNPKNLPQPRFSSKLAPKLNTFSKQINKLTSPLERTTIKKMMESREIGLFTEICEKNTNISNHLNHNSTSTAANNREKMARILESLQCEVRGDSIAKDPQKTNNNMEDELLDQIFADPFTSKEMSQLFSEPNGFFEENPMDSPTKLFKIKTSSPFIDVNRKNINIEELRAKTNFIAPPLLNLDVDRSPHKAAINNEDLLDQDLDSLMENIELPSFYNLNQNTSLKRSFQQMKPKLNKSLSESVIEKKCSLLDDDLFDTEDVEELENKLQEMEVIATQTLNKQDQSKNTIILCEKTDYSINIEKGGHSKITTKCNNAEVEQKRLQALQRLKSRSGPLMRRPNFYPTLNSSFKR